MEPPSTLTVGIVNRSGVRAPAALLRSSIRAALAESGRSNTRIGLLLTDDAEIAELNRTHRRLDEATDVLSFPAGEAWGGADQSFLGDIAISVPYAQRQAAVRGVPLSTELAYLAIHGALHLLGYDDQAENEWKEMMRAMNEAAVRAGLPSDPEWASLLHDAEVSR